jgi:hypothetical protein
MTGLHPPTNIVVSTAAALLFCSIPSEAQLRISAPVVSGRFDAVRANTVGQALRGDPLANGRVIPEGVSEPSTVGALAAPIADDVAQLAARSSEVFGALGDPIVNFAGIRSASNPPDTVMDVGPHHIVQMVNATFFQVWDKHGADLSGGPLSFGALWPVGNPCRSNAGDPIVVYDHLADRWLLSQFANPAFMCFAVSQTPSPLPADGFFLYTIAVPTFPDYPKLGVWPDAYYMTSYEGDELGVFAFERHNMLNGFAAGYVRFTLDSLIGSVRDTRILPADLDGRPPSHSPGMFLRSVDDRQDFADPRDRLEIYEFAVDWTVPEASTFTQVDDIDNSDTPALAPFNTMACNRHGAGIRDCIPQSDSDDTLDALSNRPMMQLKFRVIRPGDFRMVVNQTIDVSGTIPRVLPITPVHEVAGIRWYELQKTVRSGHWSIRQQGTYAPQPLTATQEINLLHRWMGSIAIDRFGNIALGYSIVSDDADDGIVSGNEVYPGIRYTGRQYDDPRNLLFQGEKVIVQGAIPQGNLVAPVIPQRWGDYSALTVDPLDDCTFWYTTHVALGTTRIASFKFAGCRVPAH